jgi:hypothetical protein
MADEPLYSDVLTDEDRELGFQLLPTPNPLAGPRSQPEAVPAVVFRINRSDRIIKFHRPPAEKPRYRLQRFGIWPGQAWGRANWKPLSARSYPTPALALRAVQVGTWDLVDQPAGIQLPPVIPGDPGDR